MFNFIKLIFNIAPILNNQCTLDCLTIDVFNHEGTNFRHVMGLCFNNEIYYQLSKGMIHHDILEWISNSHVLGGVLIAPSMYIKQIWDNDEDYKFYKDQIFTNLHETHSQSDHIPKILIEFYNNNHITVPSKAGPATD